MINIIMRTLTTITIMIIIGASPELTDPIEDRIWDVPLEVKIFMAEVKEIRTHTKASIKMTVIKAIITRVIKDFIIIHVEISLKVIVSQSRGRSHGHGRGNYCGHGHGRPNYRGNANYQYHQYYVHDDEYQTDQYGPPCTSCGGYNHSPKHCFKGEQDINDIMEKMNINGHQSQSSSLYPLRGA